MVVTAEDLQAAVVLGKAHIEIHAHLNLTTLSYIGGSGNFGLLDTVPDGVLSIRVRCLGPFWQCTVHILLYIFSGGSSCASPERCNIELIFEGLSLLAMMSLFLWESSHFCNLHIAAVSGAPTSRRCFKCAWESAGQVCRDASANLHTPYLPRAHADRATGALLSAG